MYREDMNMLQENYPEFVENYGYKVRFVNRVIEFV